MKLIRLRTGLLHLISIAIVCAGFTQASYAGVIETGYLVDQESRAASLARLDVMLASGNVARQLEALGVDKAMVAERIQSLSHLELLMLEAEMDRQIAGGGHARSADILHHRFVEVSPQRRTCIR